MTGPYLPPYYPELGYYYTCAAVGLKGPYKAKFLVGIMWLGFFSLEPSGLFLLKHFSVGLLAFGLFPRRQKLLLGVARI